jgi:hypothetical protein
VVLKRKKRVLRRKPSHAVGSASSSAPFIVRRRCGCLRTVTPGPLRARRACPPRAAVLQAGGARHNTQLRARREPLGARDRESELSAWRVTRRYVEPALACERLGLPPACDVVARERAPIRSCGVGASAHPANPLWCGRVQAHHRAGCWPRPPHSLRTSRRGSPSFATSLARSLVPPPPRGLPV